MRLAPRDLRCDRITYHTGYDAIAGVEAAVRAREKKSATSTKILGYVARAPAPHIFSLVLDATT